MATLGDSSPAIIFGNGTRDSRITASLYCSGRAGPEVLHLLGGGVSHITQAFSHQLHDLLPQVFPPKSDKLARVRVERVEDFAVLWQGSGRVHKQSQTGGLPSGRRSQLADIGKAAVRTHPI